MNGCEWTREGEEEEGREKERGGRTGGGDPVGGDSIREEDSETQTYCGGFSNCAPFRAKRQQSYACTCHKDEPGTTIG